MASWEPATILVDGPEPFIKLDPKENIPSMFESGRADYHAKL